MHSNGRVGDPLRPTLVAALVLLLDTPEQQRGPDPPVTGSLHQADPAPGGVVAEHGPGLVPEQPPPRRSSQYTREVGHRAWLHVHVRAPEDVQRFGGRVAKNLFGSQSGLL